MTDTLVTVENASKKYCRTLKRSLWYGLKDLGTELVGRRSEKKELRKGEFWAVKGVSFTLKRGESLALIGRNGAGKTTMFKMLDGLIKPDSGRIEVRGRMQALIALSAGFNPILTGRENIYIKGTILGLTKREIKSKFSDIVEFSGIEEFIDTPVQNYSSGMAVRLGFAIAAHVNPDVLLIDEVLAVGDWGFQRKCFNKIGELRNNGTAIALVSHNMQVISTFSDKAILLNDGRHEYFENVATAVKEYGNLFTEKQNSEITKICSGGKAIKFYDIDIKKENLYPGESFSISMNYDSSIDFIDVQIDTKIICSNEHDIYFQATNNAYNRKIDLKKGNHRLEIMVENIPINNSNATISISIWSNKRGEALFWWRIPVEFKGADFSVGKNALKMVYQLD
jgi:lipopolysaccharide transport system ATP-binding protein